MPDLADLVPQAAPGAVNATPSEIHEAVVFDDAVELGQEIRCTRKTFDARLATDPLPWTPITSLSAGGEFWPKKGDRAILVYPVGGPPVIHQWFPAADAAPDVSF